jgi:glucose/arabinose dehydrogenase
VTTLRQRIALLIVLVTALGVITTTGGEPAFAAGRTLPAGFVLRDVPTGMRASNGADPGDLLTDFAYLPDESFIAVGKFGKVTWAPANGEPREIATLPTNATGDLGLTGIAVAPDYATSHTVYTARTVPDTGPDSGANGVLRLSRWTVTMDGLGQPARLTGEQTILQTSANSTVHGITGVLAAGDGTLWTSLGDSADYRTVDRLALRAQNLDDLHGKLLHLKADGSGVPGNPYYSASAPRAVRGLVYASGFRSPFRFSIEPGTGRVVLGDVGNGRTEEVDLIAPGNNYGWPCWEGTVKSNGFKDMPECLGTVTAPPLWSYPHVGGGSVTGGVIYTGTSYPQAYRGRYFFGDYVHRTMWSMAYDVKGTLTTPPETGGFGTEIGYPVKFASVPTGGDIVYADIRASVLHRLVYAPGNQPPTAVVTATAYPATRTVTFDASRSSDPNGDALTYHWDLGDGGGADGARVTHAYAAGQESFPVTLTATDPQGAAGTARQTIYPGNHAPTIALTAPDPARTFAVGDVIAADATAADAEDGALTVRWATVIIHCADAANCHQHPGEQQEGPHFSLTFEGHPGDSHLEVSAVATDSRGATTTQTFVVKPKQRRVTIQSTAEAAFTIGDEETSSGLFTVGTPLTIIAPAQALDGVAAFEKWGDGTTDRVRQLTLPDADQTLTVSYRTPIEERYASDAAVRTALGAPTDVEQGNGSVRWRSYANGRMYWSAATGAHTMLGPILTAYLRLNGHLALGLPTTDDTAGAGGGRYNLLSGGRGYYWTQATGAHYVAGSLHTRYRALGADKSALGYPTTDQGKVTNGYYNKFKNGVIYVKNGQPAHNLSGAILARWTATGATTGRLHFPTSDIVRSTDGRGYYANFEGGSIYWSPGTGAHSVTGGIRTRWRALNAERGYLGYPTSDELAVSGGTRSNFQHGYITWNRATGKITDHRY